MQNEMRDRLIELLRVAKKNTKGATCDLEREHLFADYLIENGVVEVVRCKDCKRYIKGHAGEQSNYCDCHTTTFEKFFCMPNDYCSCGERGD